MKNIKLGIGALVIAFFAISVLPTGVFAYRGDPNVKGPNYSPERHEAILKSFETGDYEAWAALMQGRGRVTEIINKDNFAKFAEAHKLAQQGKFEEAKKIREELGLGVRNGSCQGRGAMR